MRCTCFKVLLLAWQFLYQIGLGNIEDVVLDCHDCDEWFFINLTFVINQIFIFLLSHRGFLSSKIIVSLWMKLLAMFAIVLS